MSVESVKKYLNQWGRGKDVKEFESSSATVELAAQVAGVVPGRIAKTLSFKSGEGCLLLVTAGDSRVNNAAFRARFGHKAKMLCPDETLAFTGHAVGGVSPFALPECVERPVSVYLDESMKRFHTVFPACGSAHSAIELTCDDLFLYSRAMDWVAVCTLQHHE